MRITFGCKLIVEVDQFWAQFNTQLFGGEAVSGGQLKPAAVNKIEFSLLDNWR